MIVRVGPLDDAVTLSQIPFDAEQAKIVASFWKATRSADLSLGHKAGPSVLTAEKAWAKGYFGAPYPDDSSMKSKSSSRLNAARPTTTGGRVTDNPAAGSLWP